MGLGFISTIYISLGLRILKGRWFDYLIARVMTQVPGSLCLGLGFCMCFFMGVLVI